MVRVATERENAVSSPNLSETCCQPPHPLTPHPTCWGRIRCEVHLREPSVVGGGRRWGAEGESFSGSRHWGLRAETLSSPPLPSSPPQATSPTPRIPSPLEFHCKAKSGGGKRRGALRRLWRLEDPPPRLCPPGGRAPTTTTRLFPAPELRMLSSLEV